METKNSKVSILSETQNDIIIEEAVSERVGTRILNFSNSNVIITSEGLLFDEVTGTITGTLVGYKGIAGIVNIPVSIEGIMVRNIGKYAFANNNSITSVTIPSTVTSIDTGAFFTCKNLKSVYMPKVINIGTLAFAHCINLENAYMPEVRHISTSGFGATSLSSIDLPNIISLYEDSLGHIKNLNRISISKNLSYVEGNPIHLSNNINRIAIDYGEEDVSDITIEHWISVVSKIKEIDIKTITGRYVQNASELKEVRDDLPPTITLNGDNPIFVECGDVYYDAGATAIDAVDGIIEVNIDASEVNTRKVGDYRVSFTASDSSGNQAGTITRIVKVIDTIPPIITLNGHGIVTLELNNIYEEEGASVTDNSDKDIEVNISGFVDIRNIGEYILTYNAMDSSGNKAEPVIRKVQVIDKGNVVRVTSIVQSEMVVVEEEPYTENEVTAVDIEISTVDKVIQTDNLFKYDESSGEYICNVRTKGLSPGTYKVVFDLEDGNTYSSQVEIK